MSLTSVVCKFWCNEKKDVPNHNGCDKGEKIKFGAVWEGSVEQQAASENAIFGKATPAGFIEVCITNELAAQFFEPGKSYYVTFTEAPNRYDARPAPISFIVNSEEHEVRQQNISYEEICKLAGIDPKHNPSCTISWPRVKSWGRILSHGESEQLHSGMIFTCVVTGNA